MAQYGAPNFLSAIIGGYESGRDNARRSKLEELSEQGRMLQGKALTGDQNALAQLGQIDPQAYMQTKQFSQEQKKQALGEFLSAAYTAKDPQSWKQVVERFRAQGHQFDPGEDAFENRENLLRQGMSVADQMGFDWRQTEARRDQANTDRSYGLQVRNQQSDEAYRREQLAIEKAKLGAAGPDLVELFDEQTGQPYKAKYNPQTGGFDRVGGVKAPNGTMLEVGPNGEVSFQQGMGKPLTESQSKDTAFATRASGALPIIDETGNALTNLGENIGGRAPVVGNYMKSPQYQRAEQAGKEFLQAILRKDTGAAITKEETEEYGSVYLPRPGDSPQVIEQKRISRLRALEAIKAGLPPKAIIAMEKAGQATGAGKSDSQQPRRRRYNPTTDSLE